MLDFNPTPPEFPCAGMAEWGVDAIGPWQTLVYKDVSYRFRWIPPGRFWMGSNINDAERNDNEDHHLVTLTKGFWLGETTVTQALWRAVTGENPSRFKHDEKLPVENVDWNAIQDFIQRLIQAAYCPSLALPTEAQWEYACRAGTETAFSFGDTITTDQANFEGSSIYAGGQTGVSQETTVSVASMPPNSWNLYEMHGNVWEWCEDTWHRHLGNDPVIDPLIRSEVQEVFRVVRGGSWISDSWRARSACRGHFAQGNCDDDLGFRLARDS